MDGRTEMHRSWGKQGVLIFNVSYSTGGQGHQLGVGGKLLWPHYARYSILMENVLNRIESSRARSRQADDNGKAQRLRGKEREKHEITEESLS